MCCFRKLLPALLATWVLLATTTGCASKGRADARVADDKPAVAAIAATGLDDGPYLRADSGQMLAEWVCDGKPVRRRYPIDQWPIDIAPVCGYPQALRLDGPQAADPLPPTDPARIVALSDIHGQFDLLVRLLQSNRVIDAQLRWAYGDGVMVVTGDVFDRGPRVTEAFWLLQQLAAQARAAGGEVVFLLGNHEAMVLYDDLRYVHPKYVQVAELLGRPYPALFDADSLLGSWLRTRPVLARVGDSLFLHGGIAPENIELALDAATTNAAYAASLGTPRATWKADPALDRLYNGKTSPIWYRGYFDGRMDALQARDLLQQLGVKRIVVGHTSMDEIGSYLDGAIIAIDSSIKNGQSGELLFIENGIPSRAGLDGLRRSIAEHSSVEATDH